MKKFILVLLALFAFAGVYAMEQNKEDTVLLFRDFLTLKSDVIKHCMENTVSMAGTTCKDAAKLKELKNLREGYAKKLAEVDKEAAKVVTHVEFKKVSDKYAVLGDAWRADFQKLIGEKAEKK